MKVLWIDLVSYLGPAQHSLLDFCTTLKTMDIDIVTAVPYGPLFDKLRNVGLTVYPVSTKHAGDRGWGFFSNPSKIQNKESPVSQIIRAVNPDLVHANSLAAFLAAYRMCERVPCIWHVRDCHLPSDLARRASRKAARIIASSPLIDEYLVNTLSPRVLGHVRVIRNGINFMHYEGKNKHVARERFNLPQEIPIVGMIAHFDLQNIHEVFIQTAMLIHQHRPGTHFVMVGQDLLGKNSRALLKLEAMIQQAGLSTCLHWITACDAAQDILPAFDLFMHIALNEPSGHVICEAMAASVPVIAVESSACTSHIRHNESGILVSEGHAQYLADATCALLENPTHAALIGAAGYARIRQNFSIQTVCAQLAEEYLAVLAERKVMPEDDV